MQNDLAFLWTPAMFEEVDSLPRAEGRLTVQHRNRDLHLRERSAQMRRHVVRPFILMRIPARVFGGQSLEERFEVGANLRRGVLLNEERSGSVTAEQREEACGDRLLGDPRADLARDFAQPAPLCLESQNVSG